MLLKERLAEGLERSAGDIIRSKYVRKCLSEEPGLILDVGSGGIPKGDVNMDIDRKWWDWLKRKGVLIPNFVIGDAVALPFKPGIFSMIVSCDVLEHITEDGVALSEMRRVVPGGKIVLHTPNKEQTHIISFKGTVLVSDGKGSQRELKMGEEQADHKRVGYTQAELQEKLNKAGFSTAEITATFNIVEGLAWEWDRLVVYECLAQGKDPSTAQDFPLRQKNFSIAMRSMFNFNPDNFRNFGWMVIAK